MGAVMDKDTINNNTIHFTERGSSCEPEWMRPQVAADWTGVSRSLIYSWMNEGLIRNVSLRKRGQIKATRLVSVDSLHHFLEGKATGGDLQPSTAHEPASQLVA